MREYCFTVECDGRSHTTSYVIREYKYLVGNQCPEGSEFIQALGMFENFGVMDAESAETQTTRPRAHLLEASRALLERVRQDRDYIGYDYQCGFSAEGKRRHSGRGFGVSLPGKNAMIWLHPGQIYMEFSERGPGSKFHVTEIVDLRRSGPIQTESLGLLKIYRRSNPIAWEQKLPLLIDFLLANSAETVHIRHHSADKVSR